MQSDTGAARYQSTQFSTPPPMIATALVAGAGALAAAKRAGSSWTGNAVKLAVESADRKLLGVDITVENAAVSIS